MRAGLLRYNIEFYKAVVTKDRFGASNTVWELYEKARANVKINNAGRVVQNDEIVNNYGLTFEVRMYLHINESMRIYWNGKKYRIIGIFPDPHAQKQTISAELINE